MPGTGGGPAGDLFLVVEVVPHARLRLEGSDLVAELPIAPWEAALGGQAPVPTLDGEVTIKVPAGTPSGQRIRLRGRGFPGSGGGARGDLFAEVRIVVPPQLTPRERELFEALAAESAFEPRKRES
jgi:curved DNA-binding protein